MYNLTSRFLVHQCSVPQARQTDQIDVREWVSEQERDSQSEDGQPSPKCLFPFDFERNPRSWTQTYPGTQTYLWRRGSIYFLLKSGRP